MVLQSLHNTESELQLRTWALTCTRLFTYRRFVHQFVLQCSAPQMVSGQNGPDPIYRYRPAKHSSTIMYIGVSLKIKYLAYSVTAILRIIGKTGTYIAH